MVMKAGSPPLIGAIGALCLLALLATGCSAASASAPPRSSDDSSRVIEGRLRSGGLVRSYRLFVPAHLKQPAPVVVVLHGGLQTPGGVADMTGFDREAERQGFLAVYPAGVGRTFDAGVCCGPAKRLGVDDVGFVRDLLGHLATRYDMDPSRVYATGISNGGLLAYRLACELPDVFAAVAPVAATLVGECDPSSPVSILHIHGLRDRNIPRRPFLARREAGAPVLRPHKPIPRCDRRHLEVLPDPPQAHLEASSLSTRRFVDSVLRCVSHRCNHVSRFKGGGEVHG